MGRAFEFTESERRDAITLLRLARRRIARGKAYDYYRKYICNSLDSVAARISVGKSCGDRAQLLAVTRQLRSVISDRLGKDAQGRKCLTLEAWLFAIHGIDTSKDWGRARRTRLTWIRSLISELGGTP